MRLSGYIVLALIAGALGGHLLAEDKGYVMLTFRGYVVEMSLPILVLLLALLYFVVRVILRVLRTPRQLGEATAKYRSRQSQRNFTRGLIEMSEGNWARGEKLMTRGVRESETPLLNYLSAARAAQKQNAHERRDNWLRMAYEQTPAATTAVLLTQAELQLAHHQYEEALATLRKLEESAPGHKQSLALLAGLYEELEDWDQLLAILPTLKRRQALNAKRLDELAGKAYRAKLKSAAESGDATEFRQQWLDVPRLHKDALLDGYVRGLVSVGDNDTAEKTLRKALKSNWSVDLVYLYGRLHSDPPEKLLSRVESWLTQHGDEPAVLVAAARQAMRSELWGKARSYLETSIAIRPDPDAFRIYGRLLEQLGEKQQAAEAFRAGLLLATGEEALNLPVLEAPAESEVSEEKELSTQPGS